MVNAWFSTSSSLDFLIKYIFQKEICLLSIKSDLRCKLQCFVQIRVLILLYLWDSDYHVFIIFIIQCEVLAFGQWCDKSVTIFRT